MDLKMVLKHCPLFSALPEETMRALLTICRETSCERGEEVFAQGDPCSGFYIVARGSVKVYQLSPAGREHVLVVARPGQSFGEAALFSGRDFPAFAEALEDSQLLFFPRKEFLELLDKDPKVSLQMLAGLSQWLRRIVGLLEDTVLMDVDTRLARFLLRLAAANFLEHRPGGKVRLPMQKQVLASHLATTPPTLSRAFARLEQDGLIAVRDLEIEFLNFDGLQERAEAPSN